MTCILLNFIAFAGLVLMLAGFLWGLFDPAVRYTRGISIFMIGVIAFSGSSLFLKSCS
jgi:hypothetical protein